MRKKYIKPIISNISKNNSLILKLISCTVGVCIIGTSLNLYLNYLEKKKKSKDTNFSKIVTIRLSDIKEKIEKAGIEILKNKIDTKLSLELREIVNKLDLKKELKETRIILAKFLNWRLPIIKGLNLQQELKLILKVLNFEINELSTNDLGDYIGIKFHAIFSANNFIELGRLRNQLINLKYKYTEKIQNLSQTQYDVVSFKLACLFGDWKLVEKFGKQVAEYNNVILDKNGKQCRIPMMLRFEQDAHRNPNHHPNYYEIFSNRNVFKIRFNSVLISQLQFKNWKIISIRKNFIQGVSHKMQQLKKQYEKKKKEGWKKLDNKLQKAWIYGAVVQIELITLDNSRIVFCGPWNDNEMFLCSVFLSNISKQGMQMRLEFTLELNRCNSQIVNKTKNGWLWKGKMIFKRFLPNETAMQLGKEPWMKFSTEIYNIEIILEENF